MNCFDCAEADWLTPAVAVCHDCGAAVCADHAVSFDHHLTRTALIDRHDPGRTTRTAHPLPRLRRRARRRPPSPSSPHRTRPSPRRPTLTTAMRDAARVDWVAWSTRFLLFTGKGGVGKTTIASATAVALADRRRRVLLVSTDPASNLADVLQMATGEQPTPVPGVERQVVDEKSTSGCGGTLSMSPGGRWRW